MASLPPINEQLAWFKTTMETHRRPDQLLYFGWRAPLIPGQHTRFVDVDRFAAVTLDPDIRVYGFWTNREFHLERGRRVMTIGWPKRYADVNPFKPKPDNNIFMQAVYDIVGRR